MGCASCASKKNGTTPAGCKNNGTCGTAGCNKLEVFDWLSNMESPAEELNFNYVEVRFKNSRKSFFQKPEQLSLVVGDVVVVACQSGYDVGIVTLTGELVKLQMNKKAFRPYGEEIVPVLRKATEKDIDTWQKARTLEAQTMLKARQLAIEYKLDMKISDVEYQGDGSRAIFYYTAETRVDFRELIKTLAKTFSVKIEMKQIGMRQEASRLGGIGSCGRELCCSTWLTDFRSVSTSAARYQQLSLNPSKLAGQCGKLKCCLNYELDAYLEEIKAFPSTNVRLKTEKGTASYQKMDIFRNIMWYSYDDQPNQFIELSLEKVNEIIALNKKGNVAPDLKPQSEIKEKKPDIDYSNVVGQDSLTRFDKKNKQGRGSGKGKRRKKRKPAGNNRPQNQKKKQK
jgi:cell fate regulator YaaT (PSP1 superfamily)